MTKEEILEMVELLERYQASDCVDYGSVEDRAITVIVAAGYDAYDSIKEGVV